MSNEPLKLQHIPRRLGAEKQDIGTARAISDQRAGLCGRGRAGYLSDASGDGPRLRRQAPLPFRHVQAVASSSASCLASARATPFRRRMKILRAPRLMTRFVAGFTTAPRGAGPTNPVFLETLR
ncbi:hypothetical protein [Roseococcus pinisoli]|uniref:Uncharacterized protein n=1 Tax=Roseococcus pinisoli TaxID=2835040 RepID=A0ABS5QHU8_9PROT|nr:hypothetical protein [Roseococcus pinisoli]MBS7813255.1 hypothetical protein [Roseococcus pinisoli]